MTTVRNQVTTIIMSIGTRGISVELRCTLANRANGFLATDCDARANGGRQIVGANDIKQ